MREIEFEWTQFRRGPAKEHRRRARKPWELVPAVLVVVLPLVELGGVDAEPERPTRDVSGISVPYSERRT